MNYRTVVAEIDMLKKMFNLDDNDILLIDRRLSKKKYARPFLLCYGDLVMRTYEVHLGPGWGRKYRSRTKHQYRVAYASLENVMEKVREIVGEKHLGNI